MIVGVPYDAELEYLESTGSTEDAQFIDTGIFPSPTTVFRCRCASPNSGSHYLGVMDASARRFHFSHFVGTLDIRSYMGDDYVSLGSANFDFHTLEMNAANKTASIDGTVFQQEYTTLPTTVSIWLFGCNSDNESYKRYNRYRIAETVIIQDGVVVQHFIPVRVGSIGYMYDRVTCRLFGNAGTGAFIRGPDFARPVMALRRYPQQCLGKIGARHMIYGGN